jgi:hypothetical protein
MPPAAAFVTFRRVAAVGWWAGRPVLSFLAIKRYSLEIPDEKKTSA